MKTMAFLVIPLLLANQGASAAGAMGNSALALASLVAENSPLLNINEKSVLARAFDGGFSSTVPTGQKISVEADAIVCRASNVDITSRSCTLTFGKNAVAVKGRKAHELFATIAEIGVPSEGAAGSIYEGLSHLVCAIDPHEIQQNAGGGASCEFDAVAP